MTKIDFTDCPQRINTYEGSDIKRKILFNGEVYMLKFGQKLDSDERKPLQASYSSAPVSEYLGSHIFGLAGLPAQETLLGTCEGRVVVACKDFIENRPNSGDYALVEFKKLENSFLGSSSAGGRTPLYDNLVEILSNHSYLADVRIEAENRYWQTFAIDALVGNFDRYSGNWGYILDKPEDRIIALAPVYDCGSCLYPQLNEDGMRSLLRDRPALEKRTMTFPTAALRVDGKKRVHYRTFLLSGKGARAREAVGQLLPRIDFDAIRDLIWGTPYISDVRREFYSEMIEIRRDMILQPAYELYRQEHQREHLFVPGCSPS